MITYVMQDGADFYIYTDVTCEEVHEVKTYPHYIGDFDLDTAKDARAWFMDTFNFDHVSWQ